VHSLHALCSIFQRNCRSSGDGNDRTRRRNGGGNLHQGVARVGSVGKRCRFVSSRIRDAKAVQLCPVKGNNMKKISQGFSRTNLSSSFRSDFSFKLFFFKKKFPFSDVCSLLFVCSANLSTTTQSLYLSNVCVSHSQIGVHVDSLWSEFESTHKQIQQNRSGKTPNAKLLVVRRTNPRPFIRSPSRKLHNLKISFIHQPFQRDTKPISNFCRIRFRRPVLLLRDAKKPNFPHKTHLEIINQSNPWTTHQSLL
jgi:hypothetical protein